MPLTEPKLQMFVDSQSWPGLFAQLSALSYLEEKAKEPLRLFLEDLRVLSHLLPTPIPADFTWRHPSGASLGASFLLRLTHALWSYNEPQRRKSLFVVLYEAFYDQGDADLSLLAEHWRAELEARPDAFWLRSLLPMAPSPAPRWRAVGLRPRISPSGEHLLLRGDNGLFLYSAKDGRGRKQLGLGYGKFSPDSACVVAYHKKLAHLWDPRTLAPLATFGPNDETPETLTTFGSASEEIQSVAFSPDSSLAVVVSRRQLSIWRRTNSELLHRRKLASTEKNLKSAVFLNQEQLLVLGEGSYHLWDWSASQLLWSKPAKYWTALSQVVSARGKRLVIADDDLSGYSLPDGELLFTRKKSEGTSINIHPNGKRVIFYSWGRGGLQIIDTTTGKTLSSMSVGNVNSAGFIGEDKVWIKSDDRLYIWDSAFTQRIAKLPAASIGDTEPSLSDDHQWMIVPQRESTCALWRTADLQAPKANAWPRVSEYHLDFTSDGKIIVSHRGSFSLISLDDLSQVTTIKAELIRSFPGDQLLLAKGEQGGYRVYSSRDGALCYTIPGVGDRDSYKLTPNGHLLTSDGEHTRLWDDTGKLCYEIPGMIISYPTRHLLLSNKDQTTSVRALETGEEIRRFSTKGQLACLSLDGLWFACVEGYPNQINVWDVISGEKRFTFPESESIDSIGFRGNNIYSQTTRQCGSHIGEDTETIETRWSLATGGVLPSETPSKKAEKAELAPGWRWSSEEIVSPTGQHLSFPTCGTVTAHTKHRGRFYFAKIFGGELFLWELHSSEPFNDKAVIRRY